MQYCRQPVPGLTDKTQGPCNSPEDLEYLAYHYRNPRALHEGDPIARH